MRFYPEILDSTDNEEKSGIDFNSRVFFADISGFTLLTEMLSKKGKEGTESLGEILKLLFGRTTEIIEKNNGFVSGFAGDAFTAIFPENSSTEKNFFSALFEVRENFMNISTDSQIPVKISAKIGAGRGRVFGKIIKTPEKSLFYFDGSGIRKAISAEKTALPMSICADRKSFPKSEYFESEELKEKDYISVFSRGLVFEDSFCKAIKESKENFGKYFPELDNRNLEGGFRRIVSVFVSVRDMSSFEDAVRKISANADEFKGYISMIDMTDKGMTVPVFFGMPLSREDDIKRAMDFALNLDNSVKKTFSIGISEGVAYCGKVGGESFTSYTAFGDKVNSAARLMQAGSAGDIVTDEETAKASSESFSFEFSGEMSLKGKSGKIKTFLLKNRMQKRNLFSKSATMLGREDERSFIKENVKNLIEGEKAGKVIYICGEAGTGKSRLISESLNETDMKFERVFMQCDSVLRKSFNAVSYFLREYFNADDSNKMEDKKRVFEARINQLIDESKERGEESNELLRKQSVLGALIGLRWQNSFYEKIDSKQILENTISVLFAFFKVLSSIQPVIIIAEDVHWADFETKEFFRYLTKNLNNEKIMIIATYRFDDDGAIFSFSDEMRDEDSQIMLENLSLENCKKAVEELLSGRASKKTTDYVFEKSQGNPFHIEALVKYLIDEKYIKQDKGEYDISADAADIPASISSVITARIDRMEESLRKSVLWASVLGREFEKSMMLLLAGSDAATAIKLGEEESVWSCLGNDKYIFNHALLIDCAYEMQLKKDLAEKHRKIAEILERKFKRQRGRFSDIAYHYEKSRVKDKAIIWLVKSIDESMKIWSNRDAEKMLEKLLRIQDSRTEKIETTMKLSEVLFRTGRTKESLNNYLENIEEAKRLESDQLLSLNTLEAGKVYLSMGRYVDAEGFLADAMRMFAESNQKKLEGDASGQLARVYMYRSEFDEALRMCEKSLEISIAENNLLGVSLAYGNKGTLNAMKGNLNEAERFYKERMRVAKKINDQYGITSVIGNMGIIWKQRGNYRKAVKYYLKDIEVCTKLGYEASINVTYSNLGLLYRELNEFENAEEALKKSIALSEKNGDEGTKANSLGNLGIVYKDQGMLEEAESMFLKQVSLCEKNNDRYCMCIGNGNLGLLYFNREDFDRGYKYIEKQRDIAEQIEEINNLSIAYESISILDYHRGDADRGLENVNKALSIIEGKKKDYLLCGYLCNKARILMKKNRAEEAEKLAEEALLSAKRIKRKEIIFEAGLLVAVLKKSQKKMLKMLEEEKEEEKKGYILKELYLLTKKEEYRERGLKILSSINSCRPSIYLSRAIKEMQE